MTENTENWNFSGTAKIGDHAVTIHAQTAEEFNQRLAELAKLKEEVWESLEILDDRPATAIAPKEWGARSNGRRSPGNSSGWNKTAKPEKLLEREVGATPISSITNEPSQPSTPTPHVPDANPELCATHGLKRVFHEGGKNATTGNTYSASWRCPAKGCRPLWQKKDGSFA